MSALERHRLLNVLLAVALTLTASAALSGGQPSDAVEGPVDVVYVASGRNFPDALVGGGLAVAMGAPMLTVEPSRIPDATATALTSLDPDRIIVLGGPGAVSDDVLTALAAFARSGVVERIEGADRHSTAAAIADALPAKVADADHLDGLDSSDFLRTTDADDFADAGTTAAQRVLPLGGWTFIDGTGNFTSGRPVLPEVSDEGVAVPVMVPPGHMAGTGLSIDLVIIEEDLGTCSAKLVTQGIGSRIDQTASSFTDWHAPGSNDHHVVLEAPSGSSNHLITLTLDPTAVESGHDEPGTALSFILRRDPDHALDTCTSNITVAAAQLRY